MHNKELGVAGIVDQTGQPKILYGFEYCPEEDSMKIRFSRWGKPFFESLIDKDSEKDHVFIKNFKSAKKAGILLGLPLNQDSKYLSRFGMSESVMNMIGFAKQNSDPNQKFIVADNKQHFASICSRKVEIPKENIFDKGYVDFDLVVDAVSNGARDLYFRDRGGMLRQVKVDVAENGTNKAQALLMNHAALKTLKNNGIRAVNSKVFQHKGRVISLTDNPLKNDIPYNADRKAIVSFKDLFAGSTYMSMNDIRFAFGGESERYTQFDAPQAIHRLLEGSGIKRDIFRTVLLFNHLMGNSDFAGESFGFMVRSTEDGLSSEFCPVSTVIKESTVNNNCAVSDFSGSSKKLKDIELKDLLESNLSLRMIEKTDPDGFERAFNYAKELCEAFKLEFKHSGPEFAKSYKEMVADYFNSPTEHQAAELHYEELDLEDELSVG